MIWSVLDPGESCDKTEIIQAEQIFFFNVLELGQRKQRDQNAYVALSG